MKPIPNKPVRLAATPPTPDLVQEIAKIPNGMYQVSVYTTDDQKVVSIHGDGQTYDLRIAKSNNVKRCL